MTAMAGWAVTACVGPSAAPYADGAPVVVGASAEVDRPVSVDPVVEADLSEVRVGPVVTCADPSLRDTLGRYEEHTRPFPPPQEPYFEGLGAAVADLDDDGRLDIVAVGDRQVRVWWQQGRVSDIVEQVVVEHEAPSRWAGNVSATPADLDGDGDLDLVVTGRRVPDHLLRNDGGRVFTDVTALWGYPEEDPEHHTTSASLSDVDGDGDLDVFVGGHGFVDELAEGIPWSPGSPARLLLNDGTGHLTDASDRLPPEAHDGYTFVGGWLDADGDGDDDLYVVNDFGDRVEPNRLLRNDGGWFTADLGALGLDVAVIGMGLAIGDIDGDGDEDLASSGWNRHSLMLQQAGLWFESAAVWGLGVGARQRVGWGLELADLDNDGGLELHVPYGHIVTTLGVSRPDQPDAALKRGAGGLLEDVAPAWGIAHAASTRVGIPADLNADGWLDLVKVGDAGLAYLSFARCGAEAWMELALRQPGPNTRAIGATVRVWAGGRVFLRRVRAGGTGFGSGAPDTVHVGLGALEAVDQVEITWPDGAVEDLGSLPVRTRVRVSRRP